MGSPKALLQFRGRTFLATILDAIDSAGIRTVIVVAGHHYHRIATAFPDAPVIFNANYEQGMSTSVQAGIRTLPPGLSGAAVFLVDHPLIDAKTD
jgi:CTP:molybdopterin cytidylyltransferase MocA